MSSEFGEKIQKNNENSEKYFGKFGKILKIRKNTRKKGPHSNSGKKFRKIQKIRKNTLENSEKYFEKFGKILWKIRKKNFQKSGSRTQNHFFRLCTVDACSTFCRMQL